MGGTASISSHTAWVPGYPVEGGIVHAVNKISPADTILLTLGTPGERGDGTGALLATI